MFKRKILSAIQDWKNRNSSKKKALIVKGLRQVGKTYIVDYFAHENYESVIYINFKSNPEYKNIFSGSLVVDDLKTNISVNILNSRFVDNDTLIILDEIQECNNARSSLKNFCLDGRYDVICTGSLLGIKGYNREVGAGPSTGYEETLVMKPMDFEEFLWARGIDESVLNTLNDAYTNKKKINDTINNNLKRFFKEYICVGGMPAIVEEYINTRNMNVVYKSQRNLIESYKDDFGKYINKKGEESVNYSLLTKINKVFDSVPSQLAKENKKFAYADLGKDAKKSTYEEAIDWLINFGLIVPCFCLNIPELPLEGNKDPDIFKLYFADTGLFMSQLDEDIYREILEDDLKIYKGAIYENIVADAFNKLNKKLYYYKRSSGLEIDFISVIDNRLSAVEVKAKGGKSKSLKEVLTNKEKYDVEVGYKLGDYNIGINNNIITLPHYMSFLLK